MRSLRGAKTRVSNFSVVSSDTFAFAPKPFHLAFIANFITFFSLHSRPVFTGINFKLPVDAPNCYPKFITCGRILMKISIIGCVNSEGYFCHLEHTFSIKFDFAFSWNLPKYILWRSINLSRLEVWKIWLPLKWSKRHLSKTNKSLADILVWKPGSLQNIDKGKAHFEAIMSDEWSYCHLQIPRFVVPPESNLRLDVSPLPNEQKDQLKYPDL